jgi:glutaminyl-peptide cyclotransferase
MNRLFLLALAVLTAVTSCKTNSNQDNSQAETTLTVQAPTFTADSAYQFVARQVAFGPRVPNTPAHVKGGDYLVAKLKEFGCTVTEQTFTTTTWDGKKLNARNIIGSINPKASKRILLASHWDSRPQADEDSSAVNAKKAVPAANDGASGVAVLLEMARIIQQAKQKPTVGIDLVFFDAEDWGNGGKAQGDKEGEIDYMGFCLGSRYFAKNPFKPGYTPYYGVLLDMVGAKGATFLKEGYSRQWAAGVVSKVWETASKAGFGQYFLDQNGGPITDDHLPINTLMKAPMVDIIHTTPVVGGFFPQWHTSTDDMSQIDPATLKAVGQTLLQVLYNEQ